MLVREPIYQQLNEALRGLIRGREFKAGERFLTERQIGARFRVSRATANKAVSNLVSEGVLEFRKGVGTFVRGGLMDYDLRSLVSFTGKARLAGRRPSTRVLAFEALPAARAPEAAALLGAGKSDVLYSMERLRLADGLPVILERRFVAGARCPGLRRDRVGGSLYELWTKRYGLEIAGAEETIRAASLRGAEARLLGVRPGAAALEVTALGFLRGGEPLWWERTLYRGEAYEFRNRVGPLREAGPAVGALIGRKEVP